ncbi:MAG: cysteine desulfurase NifS [Desulfuromonas sp. SDB]|nr:MAG: cysteine desulfurase NifS [Desulfuromonas sp. SDB]
MNKKIIYLDNNATTPIHPEVAEFMIDNINEYGNPSSLHTLGRRARALIEQSRQQIASFINARAEEIIFVGSGSEGNNTVLQSIACSSLRCGFDHCNKRKIITTSIEHPCIVETSKCLKDKGIEVIYLPVDRYGKIDLNYLEDNLDEKVGLVSVMMANNEIGTIQDIQRISELVHHKNALMHTDAVQAVGKIPVDVRKLGVDFLTLSGHKIYGPKGIGALYVSSQAHYCPLIRGGHQERNRRAGTENTLGIVGLGKAIEKRSEEMELDFNRISNLRNLLKQGIEKNIEDVHFNGHPEDCLYNTLNVSFSGAEGESILLYLDLEGIEVSTGSACSSGSLEPSYVILATGLDELWAHSSIRFSLGRENTEQDIVFVIDRLKQVIKKVRSMSTIYHKGKCNGK